MINLTISGKVGNDAKLLENGCVFNIASTKRGFTTKDGKVIEDKTVWVSIFGHKNLAPHIHKGDSLTVYTDDINSKIHNDKVYLSCKAVSIEFGGKSGKVEQQDNTPPPIETDDLPF